MALSFHYDGKSVTQDSVPLSIPKDTSYFSNFFSIAGRSSEEVYLLLFAPPPGTAFDCFYLFQRQTNRWVLVDSIFDSFRNRLWMSPSGALYSTGSAVFERVGASWRTILTGIEAVGINGTADNNFFVAGSAT
jgi:hypothetical protein